MSVQFTINVQDAVLQKANDYAVGKGVSLSSLIEDFISRLAHRNDNNTNEYSSFVNELRGIISLPEDYDYKSDYAEYVESKFD